MREVMDLTATMEFRIGIAFGLMCIIAVILLCLPTQGPRPPKGKR